MWPNHARLVYCCRDFYSTKGEMVAWIENDFIHNLNDFLATEIRFDFSEQG